MATMAAQPRNHWGLEAPKNHMQQSAVKGSSKNVKILRWAQGYEFEYAKCFFRIELPRYESI